MPSHNTDLEYVYHFVDVRYPDKPRVFKHALLLATYYYLREVPRHSHDMQGATLCLCLVEMLHLQLAIPELVKLDNLRLRTGFGNCGATYQIYRILQYMIRARLRISRLEKFYI